MSGRLLFLLLPLFCFAGGEKKAYRSHLSDQPRFSCLVSDLRKVPAECADNQLVCYYTRRMPRFKSDFRPDDLLGRGCDVPRNKDNDTDSCQEYTKGLDTFVRCECGTSDCNTHYWHGFATAALHHRKLLKEKKEAIDAGTVEVVAVPKYSDWFMTCFHIYLLLWVYYLIVNGIKKYRFQKRAVMMRAVLVARGTQQADQLHWTTENAEENALTTTPEPVAHTIHNYKTSLVKIMDGFIRYRSLGSLPAVDINQLRATWLMSRQDLHRAPQWFKKMKDDGLVDKQAKLYDLEFLDTARIGIESYFVNQMLEDEIELARREKKNKKITFVEPVVPATTENKVNSDPADESSSRNTNGPYIPPPANFSM